MSQISILTIFENRKDSSDFQTEVVESAISNPARKHFGKYFAIDNENGSNKFYISSEEDRGQPNTHLIDIATICTHNQIYDSTSDSCQSLPSNQISLGLQNSSGTDCSANLDSTQFNRKLGEAV